MLLFGRNDCWKYFISLESHFNLLESLKTKKNTYILYVSICYKVSF